MHKVFEGIRLSGIVKPGEIYIFTEHCPSGRADIDMLFSISAEDEIIAALDTYLHIQCGELFEAKRFIGVTSVDEDTHIIEVLCYNKQDNREELVKCGLNRLRTFQEELVRVKDLYSVE